jgi:hypothetical protein
MSQQTAALDRTTWRQALDQLSEEFEGFETTIEALDATYGDQLEAERMPLASLTYDDKDDVFVVAVGGRDGRYPVVLRHIVEHPKRIRVDRVSEQVPIAIDVVDDDGVETVVSLQRPRRG